jgi:hypothetical protein
MEVGAAHCSQADLDDGVGRIFNGGLGRVFESHALPAAEGEGLHGPGAST